MLAPDGLLQSSVPHPPRANSSAAGSRGGSIVACRSDFLGSCRELTAHDFFCKTEIQRVSSQLRFACGAFVFPVFLYQTGSILTKPASPFA